MVGDRVAELEAQVSRLQARCDWFRHTLEVIAGPEGVRNGSYMRWQSVEARKALDTVAAVEAGAGR